LQGEGFRLMARRSAAAATPKRYRVVAPYVTCPANTRDGLRIVGLYANASVPPEATDEWIRHHLDNNLIVEEEDDAPAVVEEPAKTESDDGPQADATGSTDEGGTTSATDSGESADGESASPEGTTGGSDTTAPAKGGRSSRAASSTPKG